MLLDTSGLLTLHHRAEAFHAQAVANYQRAPRKLTHGYILAEFVALAQARRLPRTAILAFVKDLLSRPQMRLEVRRPSAHLPISPHFASANTWSPIRPGSARGNSCLSCAKMLLNRHRLSLISFGSRIYLVKAFAPIRASATQAEAYWDRCTAGAQRRAQGLGIA
jgi:hypothetical protein